MDAFDADAAPFPLVLVSRATVDELAVEWADPGGIAELMSCREAWSLAKVLIEAEAATVAGDIVARHTAGCECTPPLALAALLDEALGEPATADAAVPDCERVVTVTAADGFTFPATADMAGYYREHGYRVTD